MSALDKLDGRVTRCSCGAWTFDGGMCASCEGALTVDGGLFAVATTTESEAPPCS